MKSNNYEEYVNKRISLLTELKVANKKVRDIEDEVCDMDIKILKEDLAQHKKEK